MQIDLRLCKLTVVFFSTRLNSGTSSCSSNGGLLMHISASGTRQQPEPKSRACNDKQTFC